MNKSRAQSLLQLHLTSGVDVMTSMPVVSELLKELIPSFSLSMIRVDERCAPREHYSEYFDEASHQLFAAAGAEFSVRTSDPAAFGNLLRNPRPIGTLVDTTAEYVSGATYQHLFKRNGIHHCLDIAMRDGTGPIGILGIFREERARKFSRSDVAAASVLYPHLVHACAQRPSCVTFDEVDSALVIADARGRIVWASPQARRWLEDATPGAERGPLIDAAVLPSACAELVRVLARSRTTAARASGPGKVPTALLPIPGGRLRLRAYPLEPESGASAAYVGVQLGLEMDRTLRVLRALERAALSPQQCRIALAQWKGRSTAELRALAGVSAGTLKSYQKDMYARLAVSSTAELRALLDDQARAVTLDLARHRPRGR